MSILAGTSFFKLRFLPRIDKSHFDFVTYKENTNFNLIDSQKYNLFSVVKFGTLIIPKKGNRKYQI